jgi:hypothetical protein
MNLALALNLKLNSLFLKEIQVQLNLRSSVINFGNKNSVFALDSKNSGLLLVGSLEAQIAYSDHIIGDSLKRDSFSWHQNLPEEHL